MPTDKKILHQFRPGLYALLIFLLSYFVFLLLWLQVKDVYGRGITYTASKAVTAVKEVRLMDLIKEGDIYTVVFMPLRHGADILIDIPVKTSSYTFNAPLTLAILSAMFLSIRKRLRAYLEAALMLIFIHLLYVFSLEAKEITDVFMGMGLSSPNILKTGFYQFLWSFIDNMVIRFEPFLIGFYIYLRYKR